VRYVKIFIPLGERYEEVKLNVVDALGLEYLHSDLYEKNCPHLAKARIEEEARKGKTIVVIADECEYDVYATYNVDIVDE